jgi:hypothetical protein
MARAEMQGAQKEKRRETLRKVGRSTEAATKHLSASAFCARRRRRDYCWGCMILVQGALEGVDGMLFEVANVEDLGGELGAHVVDLAGVEGESRGHLVLNGFKAGIDGVQFEHGGVALFNKEAMTLQHESAHGVEGRDAFWQELVGEGAPGLTAVAEEGGDGVEGGLVEDDGGFLQKVGKETTLGVQRDAILPKKGDPVEGGS